MEADMEMAQLHPLVCLDGQASSEKRPFVIANPAFCARCGNLSFHDGDRHGATALVLTTTACRKRKRPPLDAGHFALTGAWFPSVRMWIDS
jgi:hypothetical protein